MKNSMTTFLRIAQEIGELVEEKNAAYGSSFAKAGPFLELLYPDGINPYQYDDALFLVRIFDKQMRIATDRDALGESPYRDIAGYGILGATQVEQKRKESEGCGSASAGDATKQSKAETDFAVKSAAKPSPAKSSERTGRRSTMASRNASTATSSSRNRR